MKQEKMLKISDLKVGDRIRIKNNFFKDISVGSRYQEMKGKIYTIVELQPTDSGGIKLDKCVRLDETDTHHTDRCWHVDWVELVDNSLEKDFVNKIIEYLKGSKDVKS